MINQPPTLLSLSQWRVLETSHQPLSAGGEGGREREGKGEEDRDFYGWTSYSHLWEGSRPLLTFSPAPLAGRGSPVLGAGPSMGTAITSSCSAGALWLPPSFETFPANLRVPVLPSLTSSQRSRTQGAHPSPALSQQCEGQGSPAGSEWQQAASSACQITYIIQEKYSFKAV